MSPPVENPQPVIVIATPTSGTPTQACWFGLTQLDRATEAATRQGLLRLSVPASACEAVLAAVKPGLFNRKGQIVMSAVDATAYRGLVEQLVAVEVVVPGVSANEPVPVGEAPPLQTALAAATPQENTDDGLALWEALTVKMVVLAPELDDEGNTDGWWEAVILAIEGNSFKMKWRDYPEQGVLRRPRHLIAIMYPTTKRS